MIGSGNRGKGAPASTEGRMRTLPYLLLALLLVFDFAYAVFFASGPTNLSEDDAYADLALMTVHGQLNPVSLDSVRVLEYVPIAAFFSVFGTNTLAGNAWNIVLFVGSVLVAFLIGRELYGERCGLLSALFLSFFVPAVNGAIRLEINESVMFFTALAVLALLYGHNRKSRRWMFASGFLLVASSLTIPIVLGVILFAAVYALVELARRKSTLELTAYLAAGALSASVAVLALSAAAFGDPLALAHLNGAYYSNLTMASTEFGVIGAPFAYTNGSTSNLVYYMSFYPEQLFGYGTLTNLASYVSTGQNNLSALAQILANTGLPAGYYFYAAVAGLACLLVKRERRIYFPALWLIVGLAFLQFAPQGLSISPFRWILIFRDVRYLSLVAVPVCVLIAMALSRFSGIEKRSARDGAPKERIVSSDRLPRAAITVLALLFLLLTSLSINLQWSSLINAEYYSLHSIAAGFAGTNVSTNVYYPSGDYPRMILYTGGNRFLNLQMFDGISNCSKFASGSYLIIPNVSAGFSPPWPYVANTTEYCPGAVLLSAPYDSSAPPQFQHQAAEYAQRLYFIP
ncbi:MAG: glycosyltransferase family 39 protein [Candidatus Micrarchaeota archaeon]|nr:glycosyltransferase family 39 protein [Candidatus Micrarchaeota archaeon]